LSSKPTVSIVIATLGNRESVVKTISSVVNQSFENWEVIIVCEDLLVLDKFKIREDSRIKIIKQIEAGIYQNFNLGILHSQGDFIAVLNDDDWYESNFLELALKSLSNSEYQGVYGDCILHLNTSSEYRVSAKVDLEKKLLFDFIGAYHTTFLLRRSCFDDFGFFRYETANLERIKYANDYEWFVNAIQNGLKLIKNEDVVGHFHLGGASTVQRLSLIKEGKIIAAVHSRNIIEKIAVNLFWDLRFYFNKWKKSFN
jgi:glycosyltransferase involved in cell wall biosynthesis